MHALPLLLCGVLASPAAGDDGRFRSLIFNHDVVRRGFHLQIAFGLGGGPDNDGLFHAAEVGYTFGPGVTVAMLHTFIQNKGIIGPERGPDLLGGWMLEVKWPLLFPELEIKLASGFGGLHDQSNGIRVIPGFGAAVGFDFHLPIFERSGPTLGFELLFVRVAQGSYWGGAAALGYTFF